MATSTAIADVARDTVKPVRTRQSTRTRSTRSSATRTIPSRDREPTVNQEPRQRSRASTRNARPENRSMSNKPSTRQNRPSTRSAGSTRTASTRASSTRVRQSTRKPVEPNVIEADSFLDTLKEKCMSVIKPIIKRDALESQEDDYVPPSRTDVYGEKRQQAKYRAPLNFLVAMFFVIIVSVIAFGIIRGDGPSAEDKTGTLRDHNGEVIYYENGTTSTNTGILRGGK